MQRVHFHCLELDFPYFIKILSAMKKVLWISLFGLVLTACSGRANSRQTIVQETPPAPRNYTYRVVASHPHSTDSYTQGLLFADGVMWEGTGNYGQSHLQRIDLETGTVKKIASLPRSEFGEGIALLDGKIYQLTWMENKAYVYDAATGKVLRTFTYTGEGWGLTTDGEQLYMSDGSEYIRILDPGTFNVKETLAVTYEGAPVRMVNELEWIDGKIWANVYLTQQIIIINPETGRVEGVVDLRGLLPEEDITAKTDVLNGIAYDAATGRIFVTGKNWSKIFEIELIEQ